MTISLTPHSLSSFSSYIDLFHYKLPQSRRDLVIMSEISGSEEDRRVSDIFHLSPPKWWNKWWNRRPFEARNVWEAPDHLSKHGFISGVAFKPVD